MKFSFMSFSCPELNLDEMIAVAKKYGYDGIEPRISSNHKHKIELDSSQSFRKECKEKTKESGIAFSCIATSCKYANPATNKDMISDTHKSIDLAADIGAPVIRVFGGVIPTKEKVTGHLSMQSVEGVTREKAINLLVKSMQSVADHAAEKDVTICLETHDHWRNPKHLAEVMMRVNHPAIAVNWDIMHPIRVGVTIDEAFQILKSWIKYVHFHDGIIKAEGKIDLCVIGKGDIDHQRAVQLLKDSNYNGFLSGEWIGWEPYEIHLPRELGTLKRYEKECKEK